MVSLFGMDGTGTWSIIRTILIIILLVVVFNLFLNRIKSSLLKKVRTKQQMHNVQIFIRIISYVSYMFIFLFAILAYAGSWTGLGLGIGFLSAALGWALQKPITGIAAWLMIIVQKPFRIGDRINIGGVRGDVADIRLTHIYLNEIGGLVPGEENSGRLILIPNSTLFDQNITNYTQENEEYVLDQVSFTITFSSNLDKAKEITLRVTNEITAEVVKTTGQKPYIRVFFSSNGLNVNVRYMSPATNLQQVSSNITEEIYKQVRKEADIELSYTLTKVLLDRDDKRGFL